MDTSNTALDIKTYMKNLYGENKTIEGIFDEELSAKCENGTFIGKEKDGILIFKGIPFAKPPVGERRWKAPEPVDPQDTVREAYYFGKAAIQAPLPTETASKYPTGEDCLYLNVWASKDRSQKKPVMVFIHGGAYGYGGTCDPIYEGTNFIKEHSDVILVTIAYRVGIMGFIDFSMLPDAKGYEDSGNLGILDQIEALKWIKKNISAFGGDSENVTLFGESAGGGSVSLLPLIKQADGLFNRVIAESGSVALTYSREEAGFFTKLLLKETGKKCLKELLSMTEEELYNANIPINEKNNFPIRDGRLLPEDLLGEYRKGRTTKIDMICGSNKDECRYWIGEVGGVEKYVLEIPVLFENHLKKMSHSDKKLAREYYKHGQGRPCWRLTEFVNDIAFRVPAQKQLELHTENGGRGYHYFWTFPSSIPKYGACHAVELSAVFNNPDVTIYTGGNYNEELAKEVRNMWVNFAKTGNPSTKDHEWPLYNGKTKQTLILGEEIKIKENLLSRRTKIIEQLLKYKINGNYVKLDYNIPYIKFLGILIIAILIIAVMIIKFAIKAF